MTPTVSIFRRLSILVAGTLFLTAALVVGITVFNQYQLEQRMQEREIERIERNVLPVVSYLVWVLNTEQTVQIADSLSQMAGVSEVVIEDEEGQVIYASATAAVEGTPEPRTVRWELKHTRGDEEFLLGHMSMTFLPPRQLIFAGTQLLLTLLLQLVVLFIPTVLFVAAFRRIVSRPLKKLARDMSTVELAHELPQWWAATEQKDQGLETRSIRQTITKASLHIQQEIQERVRTEAMLKASLDEKIVLLQEVHHRVKNNLQLMASLIALQRQAVSDPAARSVLEASESRVVTMSLVHELLYREQNYTAIDLAHYLHDLTHLTVLPKPAGGGSIEIEAQLQTCLLGLDIAIPIGLITNELLSNAAKHAFVGAAGGTISVTTRSTAGTLVLTVEDDGCGLPADWKARAQGSLGLLIIEALCDQLGTQLEQVPQERGTCFTITIPFH
ncbi:MAG: sensor histidine kinase [Spirochaetaceae bacterium]|nr:MAG: sensor histidine kinase [Spirochaetaceae bacterium]